jgi:protoheme IX farnesyltransferase
MSRHSFVTALDPSGHGRRLSLFTPLSDYWTLTKPEVNFLILITTFVGFYLGYGNEARAFSFVRLFNTLLGTLLVASGTATLNQFIERNFDAQMRRTAMRPAAAGRLKPAPVLAFGVGLAVAGNLYLAATVNLFASILTALTSLTYLFVYTPLKRKTPFCVLVGAFPGAMPPLIGWAAASHRLNIEAGILYAMLFLWQFPHFMAIAWMYREDYDRAGYLMVPKRRARLFCVLLQTILPLFGLILLSLMQLSSRHAIVSSCTEILLGLGLLYFGLEFAFQQSRTAARRLLAASIAYLPLLFVLRATLRSAT